jgi:pantoate--beta-alanine ligase
MRVVDSKADTRAAVREVRSTRRRVALVPTMGFLHDGHLSLIDRARELADWVGVSVFVNPLQFGPAEDLERYPRDLERDAALAAERGADLLFAPSASEMYPAPEPWITVSPVGGANRLCGASRPDHFRGVLTIVAKLFGIFAPDVAIFGQKDFQQVALIRRMVEDLDFPVHIDVVSTVREADGLALSSRNVYLSPVERERALVLFRGLQRCRALFAAGETDGEVLRAALRTEVSVDGVALEYADVVDPRSLEPLARASEGAVCAVAARVGATRLIDNALL